MADIGLNRERVTGRDSDGNSTPWEAQNHRPGTLPTTINTTFVRNEICESQQFQPGRTNRNISYQQSKIEGIRPPPQNPVADRHEFGLAKKEVITSDTSNFKPATADERTPKFATKNSIEWLRPSTMHEHQFSGKQYPRNIKINGRMIPQDLVNDANIKIRK